jgi:Ca2+-binding RTX toxin-like protein
VLIGAAAVATIAVTATVAVSAAPAARRAPTGSLAALVGTAAPGSDATIEATIFSVDPYTVGDATVACPAGKRVVGGGVGQPPATEAFGYVQQSGPLDETGTTAGTTSGDVGRSWFASVYNSGGTQREFRVFAICSASSDATIQSNPLSVPSRGDRSASVDCPTGKRAVGGGIGQSGATSPLFASVQRSGPVDETGTTANTDTGDVATSWFASVHNFSDDVRDFKVLAICSGTPDATIAAKTFTVAADTLADATVACPAGSRALGGGLGQPDAAGSFYGYLLQSGPADETGSTLSTDTGDVARGWAASVVNTSGAEARQFKVFAICVADTAASPGTTTPVATARCAGARATIVGTARADVLRGTAGADVIAGLGGNDTITGLGGNDTVCGGSGNDSIAGGAGNDKLYGELGNDRLSGGPGNDILLGGPGVDSLDGGPGRNTVKP